MGQQIDFEQLIIYFDIGAAPNDISRYAADNARLLPGGISFCVAGLNPGFVEVNMFDGLRIIAV